MLSYTKVLEKSIKAKETEGQEQWKCESKVHISGISSI